MTNNITKTLIAGIACVALVGTTLAAPMRGNGGRAPHNAPAHQQAPMHNGGPARTPPPHGAQVAHHAPAPERHHAPPPEHRPAPPPAHVHNGHHRQAGWIALGAAVVGGIVGGIVGACR